jgi:hypothetical protein
MRPQIDVRNAVQNYRKALETDAAYPNADFANKFIAQQRQGTEP